MTISTKVSAAGGLTAATTTLSVFFATLTSATTASLITLITSVVSNRKSQYFTKWTSQNKTFIKYQAFSRKIFSNVRTFVEDAFLFVFTATWLFLAGLPYGGLLFWRWANLIYLRLKYGMLTDLVNGFDIIGTIDEPTSKQVIMSLKVLKGSANLEEIRSRCEQTVSRRNEKGQLMYRKFFQYLDMIGGYYCWMPADFDMKHHVRIFDGCDPEKIYSESDVMDILSQIANKAFEPRRAPWEIIIIPKFAYNKELSGSNPSTDESEAVKYGMIIRIHHGIGDGFSLMKLILRDMAGEKDYKPPVKNPGKPWPWYYRIFAFFYILWKSPRGFYKEMSSKDSNPLHNVLTKVCGEKYIVWSEQINVQWLKDLKAEMKIGMNTMLFGAVSGALRAYILEQEQGSSKLPSEITALVPAPAPNHPNNAMTNKFAIIIYPLECRNSDPRIRCAAIDKVGKEIATSPQPHVNLFLAQLIGVAPTIFSKYFIYNTQATVVISNLPGPDRSINIWDKPLVETMFWLPNVGHSGISVSFLSYKDTVRIGMTVDRGIIPEGQQGAKHLVNLIIRELEKMARVVGKNPKGHGISDDLLFETGTRLDNSDDELEELLLPDSSPVPPGRRRRKTKNMKDIDSTSSSSEDYGFVEDESLDGEDGDNRNAGTSTPPQKIEGSVVSVVRSRKNMYNSTKQAVAS